MRRVLTPPRGAPRVTLTTAPSPLSQAPRRRYIQRGRRFAPHHEIPPPTSAGSRLGTHHAPRGPTTPLRGPTTPFGGPTTPLGDPPRPSGTHHALRGPTTPFGDPPRPSGTHARPPSPRQAAHAVRRRAILFYGGPRHRPDGAGLDGVLERRDWDVHIADTAADPALDLTIPSVILRYVQWLASGTVDAAGFAPVCTSLSGALRPAVRDDRHPWGLPRSRLPVCIKGQPGVLYVTGHNDMLRGFFELLRATVAAGLDFWVEQPGDTFSITLPDGSANPFHHPHGAHTAHLFRFAEWTAAVAGVDGEYIALLQCPLGAPSKKPTLLFATRRLAVRLRPLADLPCVCTSHVRLRGRNRRGQALTRLAQAFPGRFNLHLGVAMHALPDGRGATVGADAPTRAAAPARGTAADEEQPPSDDVACGDVADSDSDSDVEATPVPAASDSDSGSDEEPPTPHTDTHVGTTQGGELHYGPQLDPRVREAERTSRTAPPRYASRRRLDPASPDELRRRPYPITPPTRRPTQGTRVAGQPHASAPDATQSAAYSLRPRGDITIWQLFMWPEWDAVEEWLRQAEDRMQRLQRGEHIDRLPTLVVPQTALQPWARGIIWDCRSPRRCTPCQPSTADTTLPGPQLDRAAYRAAAARVGLADEEVVRQAGGGGIEAGADVSLDMVLAFHHDGVSSHFAAAAEVIAADAKYEFIEGPYYLLPFVPIRLGPRNVVMQDRPRLLPNGELEWYEKARVTFNLAYGIPLAHGTRPPPGTPVCERFQVAPPNAGVPRASTSVQLPSPADFCEGAAIVGDLARAETDIDVEGAAVDISNAYSYLYQQRLDWWFHSFVWLGGIWVSRRVVFGGAFGPQAFVAVMSVPDAVIAADIAEIERVSPPPASVQAACRERASLQSAGLLPPGAAQTRSWMRQWFLDDGQLAALNDQVAIPAHLAGVETGHVANTLANGGRPSAVGSRIHTYLRAMVHALQALGFTVAITKTQAGTVILVLGLRARITERRMDIPPQKRQVILDAARHIHARAEVHHTVERQPLEQLVGRLGHVATVEPALLLWLNAGYALICARTKQHRHLLPLIRLRAEGRRQRELLTLLEVAIAAVEENAGVAMAAALPLSPGSPGVLTIATDASLQPLASPAAADDGVGGYAFHADEPGRVYVFSVPWPADIRAALVRGTLPAADRSHGDVTCMPLAETLGSLALPLALSGGRAVRAVVAIGDCDPSASAITAGVSASAQVRELLRTMFAVTQRWTGVSVPREWNTDPDRLSHPSQLAAVLRDVPSSLQAVVVGADQLETAGFWRAARAAVALPLARAERAAAAAAERISVGRKGSISPTAGSQVLVTRPLPMGNPFSVLSRGRLDGRWRDACCDAFADGLQAAVSGATASLADIASRHGLPPGSVQWPYSTRSWDEYAAALREALRDARHRAAGGEELVLTCVCTPKRCHADRIRQHLCQDCD